MKGFPLMLIASLGIAWNCGGTTPPSPVTPTPTPIPVELTDGGVPTDPVVAACAHLAALGCPEGVSPSCARVMHHAIDLKLTPVPLACITSAATPEAERACGFATCSQ